MRHLPPPLEVCNSTPAFNSFHYTALRTVPRKVFFSIKNRFFTSFILDNVISVATFIVSFLVVVDN